MWRSTWQLEERRHQAAHQASDLVLELGQHDLAAQALGRDLRAGGQLVEVSAQAALHARGLAHEILPNDRPADAARWYLAEPDIDRLLAALAHRVPDRFPLLEMGVFSPTLEHLIGSSPAGGLTGVLNPVERAAYERGATSSVLPQLVFEYPQPPNNMTITPGEYVTLCRRASFDAMVVCPGFRRVR